MEDIFFWLTEWVGVDFASMSRRRMAFALTIQIVFALLFIIAGVLAFIGRNGHRAPLLGAFLVVCGLGFLARIAIHLRPVLRRNARGA